MIIAVDPSSAVPPFEQLRVQIARMVSAGVLTAGTRLPTIAQLANDLSLAPGTVARAYRELEAEGFVVSKRRSGTIVADQHLARVTSVDASEVDSAIGDFVRRLRQLGVSVDDVMEQLRAAT
jgi:GntR family transcriptional regulator